MSRTTTNVADDEEYSMMPGPTVIDSETLGTQIYASQQQGLNLKLISNVEDACEASTALHLSLQDLVSEWRSRWEAANQQQSQLVQALETEFKNAEPKFVDPHTLGSNCGLELLPDFFQQYGTAEVRQRPQAPSPSDISKSPVGDDAASQRSDTTASANYTAAEAAAATARSSITPMLDELHKKNTRLVRKDDIKSGLSTLEKQWFPLCDSQDLVQKLFDSCQLEHADPLMVLRAELAQSLKQLASLEAQLLQNSEERAAALRNENIAAAEARTSTIMSLYKEILNEIWARRENVESSKAEVDGYVAHIATAKNRLPEICEEVSTKQVKLIQSCQSDRRKVQEYRKKEREKSAVAQQQYQAALHQFKVDLDNNHVQQMTVWDEIAKGLAKLDFLRQQRCESMKSRIGVVQTEQARIQSHDALEQTIAENLRRCERTETIASQALVMAQLTKEYIENAFAAIQDKNFEKKRNSTALEEAVRYYDSFKNFQLFTSELLYRGEQRLENCKRMVRNIDFQLKLAAEALDTELPSYREQLQKAQRTQADLQQKLLGYKEVQTDEATRWHEVEAILEAADVDYEPPELLVQQMQRDLLQVHMEAVDELTNQEQKILDQEKRSVRTMHNLCDATKATLEERKATRIAAHASPKKLTN